MQLTRHTDYSLRVLIYLAFNKERRITISEIADYFQISRNHLLKVAHQLVHHGFINSVQGRNGGLWLAMPAKQINIGSVVRLMEPGFQMAECFNSKTQTPCRIAHWCTLKGVLNSAKDHFLDTLDQYTLANVISTPDAQVSFYKYSPPIRG